MAVSCLWRLGNVANLILTWNKFAKLCSMRVDSKLYNPVKWRPQFAYYWGFLWLRMAMNEWIFVLERSGRSGEEFNEFYSVLQGFTGFYWVLLGSTGFYWVLPSFTEFSTILSEVRLFQVELVFLLAKISRWLNVLPSFTYANLVFT